MSNPTQLFNGIGASRGIAIGKVCLLDRRKIKIPRYHIQPSNIEKEISRLKIAIEQSYQQLETIRSRFSGNGLEHASILEAHEMMVQDPALLKEASQIIQGQHYNAEWAVSSVVSRLRVLFEEVEDSYLKQRRSDVDFVGDRIIRNLIGTMQDATDLGTIEKGTIIVAYDLSPADTAILARQEVTAFITEVGGKTSHSSIIARSMDVPAAVGVHGIFEAVGDGDIIAVDGTNGNVELKPNDARLAFWKSQADSFAKNKNILLEAKELPALTLDSIRIQIAGNLELPSDAATVFERGGEAIGLYRTEFLYAGVSTAPSQEDHFKAYSHISKLAGDRVVTIRTLDLGADKLFTPGRIPTPEPNPVLGLRGIRYCLANPELFRDQLAGILRASIAGNIRILLPMISDASEITATRAIINDVEQELEAKGIPHGKNIPLGSMIEVPSAVFGAEQITKEADFISIGTNDLLQYLLAIDRTNQKVAYLYQPLHPAVLQSLKQIIQAAHGNKIPVSICGEMAGEILHIPVLIGLGFRQLSMNAGSIPRIKKLIREISNQDCEQLVRQINQLQSATEIQTAAQDFLNNKLAQESQVWTPNFNRTK